MFIHIVRMSFCRNTRPKYRTACIDERIPSTQLVELAAYLRVFFQSYTRTIIEVCTVYTQQTGTKHIVPGTTEELAGPRKRIINRSCVAGPVYPIFILGVFFFLCSRPMMLLIATDNLRVIQHEQARGYSHSSDS